MGIEVSEFKKRISLLEKDGFKVEVDECLNKWTNYNNKENKTKENTTVKQLIFMGFTIISLFSLVFFSFILFLILFYVKIMIKVNAIYFMIRNYFF
jgi:lipopolysaccharide/colanic/teichoic acid biosynthesis glycosyltransferase